ncbi:histidine--tRNA ligase [Pseudochrobactrum algeriensis]|uniref:histidine--tRNA ligase n=1 Tax=Pseudochrobactrum algeriensis TaxID=2834768 RepID=UPI001BD15DF1|nr:histidine--tRNA ligase [Pseudochrobactrum algeriensis]MBX8812020.1 histidine--tRNA ligase [Ochrobactrum sp. MR34]QVQ37432.1 histidine--tRNA ligase [Pseudochrobactrum algeriensis]QVQ40651.1 histidine--tRNA ligase [Pseudochrobactrum algeriensis]QVQ44573.1 histidine--tRNA ligase [Pseudochrobactrum algeriensis]
MANKAEKMKARLPRGFVDREPHDLRAAEKMLATIREVYERYGFDPIETPLVEYTDALGKFLPDQDRPNEGVFSLQDDDEQWLSLRYDLTAPLARHVAENFNEIQLPFRTYRNGWVFRNEKPGPGRFRQFMQFDADTVGAPGVSADAEMCMMAADTLERLGIQRGDYMIRVNSRKVLDGVLEAIGLAGDDNAGRRLNVLRAIDKLDKFGEEGVKLLLGEGRRDESGDFTKGAGLDAAAIAKVLDFTAAGAEDGQQTIANLRAVVEGNARGTEGVEELAQMQILFDAGGYAGRVKIDPSVVRGLEYYTGPVYEAELQFDVTNEKGEKVVFGSVGGGGRYDGLVSRFRGQPVPATGFSIGVSRLMTALKNLGKLGTEDAMAPVVITVMDGDAESLGRYQKFTQDLRDAGIRAEMYQGNWKKFGNQLKYADRRNAPLAIIQGGDERANGEIQIKDLIEGKRLSGEIESNEEWRASRPAQITVKEADLVAEVKRILAEQAEDRLQELSRQAK